MVPCFIVNGHNYAKHVQELKPSINDLDADGSGRNILDGKMHRSIIDTKDKWTVTFLRLDEPLMAQLMSDLKARQKAYPTVNITMLDAIQNAQVTRTYYYSTVNQGVQRYISGKTVYDGVTFNITEQ